MESCTCGIYALNDAMGLPLGVASRLFSQGYVFGRVKLWGKVIRGDRGARAQHAYPSRLYIPSSSLTDSALRAFGVPLIPVDPARDDPPDDYPMAMAA